MEVKIYGTSDEVKDFLANEIHKASFVTDCDEHIYDCELDESYDDYLEVTFIGTVITDTGHGLIVKCESYYKKPCQLHIRKSTQDYYENDEKIKITARIIPKRFLQFGCALVARSIEKLQV